MKYLCILFLVFSFTNLYSQDIILKKNGRTIESKIDEVGIDNIKFHKNSNLSGPSYIISKKDVTKITFQNGDVEIFDVKDNYDINEVKRVILKNINEYGFERDSYSKKYKGIFEGDYLWLELFNKKGKKIGRDYLYDLSLVYKFAGVDKRKDDLAYINIWTSLLLNQKKDRWEKDKLVMRVYGYKNADKLYNALKEYNRLLNLE